MNHQVPLAFPKVLLDFDADSPGRPGHILALGDNIAVLVDDGESGVAAGFGFGCEAGADGGAEGCAGQYGVW